MQRLIGLEEAIGRLFRKMPHLPRESRDWIADNIWWLVIIGLVLSAMTVLDLLLLLFGASLYMGLTADIAVGSAVFITTMINLAMFSIVVVLEAMAIKQLHLKRRYGWELLFVICLVLLAGSVLRALMNNSLSGLLNPLVVAFISFYLLFEIRDYFVVKSSRKR